MVKDMLSGISVVDCSSLIPGPLCSMMLSDLGAHVTKVEGPQGDRLRFFGGRKESPYFSVLNREKEIRVLDLKTKRGVSKLQKLIAKADVLITGTRPGKAAQLGLSPDHIHKINRKIVHCSITGYGTKGRESNKAGHDLNYLARSGVLAVLSRDYPEVPQVQPADLASGMLACSAILGALFSRAGTGRGMHLDLSMADASSYFFGMYLAHEALLGKSDPFLRGKCPCYNLYETKDGRFVALGAVEEKFWKNWCAAVGIPSLLKEQWSLNEQILRRVKNEFKGRTAGEWQNLNDTHDFCCEEVLGPDEAVNLGLRQKKWKLAKGVPFPSSAFGLV